MSAKYFYLENLKNESRFFYIFIVFAFLCPFLALLVPIRPEGQELSLWFQRSGAAMIIFALLAETRAISVYNIINPSGMVSVGHDEATEEFGKKKPAIFNSISFFTIAIGTFIWGYGDLIFL